MMIEADDIKPTPWDAAVFGMPTWELANDSEQTLKKYAQLAGHQTLRVDPLSNKGLLQAHGFYYCDTLMEPRCTAALLRPELHVAATINKNARANDLLEICHGAFAHDRFHRDFNLSSVEADLRYNNWLNQLVAAGQVYGLYWHGQLAGFIAHQEKALILHAVAQQYRSQGLAKFWWSAVCNALLASGFTEVSSSISASNTAVVNLYASLGFSFFAPKDVYHRFVIG